MIREIANVIQKRITCRVEIECSMPQHWRTDRDILHAVYCIHKYCFMRKNIMIEKTKHELENTSTPLQAFEARIIGQLAVTDAKAPPGLKRWYSVEVVVFCNFGRIPYVMCPKVGGVRTHATSMVGGCPYAVMSCIRYRRFVRRNLFYMAIYMGYNSI